MSQQLRLKLKIPRERARVVTVNTLPSLTRQSEAKDCDVNVIVEQFSRGAEIRHVQAREPVYADVSDVPDYRTALDIVRAGEAAFAALDPAVRKRFDNDPALMLEFLGDEKNLEEARKLGMLKPEEPPAVVQKVEVVNPPPKAA